MAAPVKVAFTGDQGAGEGARAVLSLIASEGAELLLLQGDLGYDDGKAAIWEENLTQALGADFPVLTVVGNHENFEWPLYKRFIQQRIDRSSELSCSGDTGVKAFCRYKNIEIVQVSPGIDEVDGVDGQANYADFISSSFADSAAPWRICAWHKNQSKMQTGKKSDATGWDVYDACLDAGAMIALAHEHAYSRSHLLSDFKNQSIAHKNSEMTLEPGRSFGFVSGLGGHEVREQVQGGDWWASIYTASQGATHGALFCTFEDTTADCYFKAIDGAMPDQFTLKTRLGSNSEPETTTPVNIADSSGNEPVITEPVVEPEVADLSIPEVTEPAAALMTPEEQFPVIEPEVVEPIIAESLVATEVPTPTPTPTPTPAAVAVAVEVEVQYGSESGAIADESAATGPLTVVPGPDMGTGNFAPSTIDSTTDVAKGQNASSGSSGGVVGAGNISLFLLLVLMARIGQLRAFCGYAYRTNGVC